MREPLVCAIMLTKDRPEMAARAVRAFREQAYQNKAIVVLDTGKISAGLGIGLLVGIPQPPSDAYWHPECAERTRPYSIGDLRNYACSLQRDAEIFVHWDDDDWSHPNRITEQVAHLQSSGADVVGYDELLFWRTYGTHENGEVWIYRNKLAKAGTSFCYWRKTWEARPFPDLPRPERGACGEDWEWAAGLNMARVSGVGDEPRIIASIHGGNTSPYEIVEGANWHRAPEFEEYARERMQL